MESLQLKTIKQKLLNPSTIFLASTMIVNGGNYFYNIILGRSMGPSEFAEVGLVLTWLLVASFIGMTFQLTAAKFTVDLDNSISSDFNEWIKRKSIIAGLALVVLLIAFQSTINEFFHLSNSWILIVFTAAIPTYFLMSTNRGILQGAHQFDKLALSYQLELWIKVGATICLLIIFPKYPSIAVAAAIVISIFHTIREIPINKLFHQWLTADVKRKVYSFFIATLLYELTQILINYGDLIVVKHYFDNASAGLYTSLSLIGRMIYFVTWMLVMLLIPKVLKLRKENKDYLKLMFTYVSFILIVSAGLVFFTAVFPHFSVKLIFGEAYLPIAPVLWKYTLATACFALGNLFIYFFIATDRYWPSAIAGVAAIGQIIAYTYYHNSIKEIVHIQVIGMGLLLATQVLLFIKFNKK